MAEAAATKEALTYGNWRKPQSPGVAGLGLLGTGILLVGMLAVVVLLAVSLLAAVVGAAVVATALAPLIYRDRHGRSGLQKLGALAAWSVGKPLGRRTYRSGPLGRPPTQRFGLPGLAAQMTATDAIDAWGRPFVLLHHPATAHVSTVLETAPDGNALVDQETVDQWVANWGAWLTTLGQETGLVGAQVSVETAPDPGTRLGREVEAHLGAGAPELARRVMAEVVESYPAGSASISCRIALTWSRYGAFGGPKRSLHEMALEIGNRLPGLSAPLAAAGAGAAEPMTSAALAAAVRLAYDPSAQGLIEELGPAAGIDWADAAPVAQEEGPDWLYHDGATSVTWAMSQAPRGVVYSSVLAKLLAPHPDIARKRVSLLYRPHDSARAAELVERDRRDALFNASGGRRRVVSARSSHSVQAAEQAAEEEARGAGLVRFGMLVTATVMGQADRARARQVEAVVDSLATSSRVVLRRAWGSQSAGFLAALPLRLGAPRPPPGALRAPGGDVNLTASGRRAPEGRLRAAT